MCCEKYFKNVKKEEKNEFNQSLLRPETLVRQLLQKNKNGNKTSKLTICHIQLQHVNYAVFTVRLTSLMFRQYIELGLNLV